MKNFRYAKGHSAGSTMTVKELKEKLSEYPDSMPVFCQWEGVYAWVDPENFSAEEYHKGMLEDKEICLIIDVDQY
jgi:hypothetical protein